MSKRRRRHTLPKTRAQVLYAQGNDRVTVVLRFKGGTVVEATYSVRNQRVEYVQASAWGQRADARLTDLDTSGLQYQLDDAVQEFRETFHV